jgi:phenylalanine-4-hydroxylase
MQYLTKFSGPNVRLVCIFYILRLREPNIWRFKYRVSMLQKTLFVLQRINNRFLDCAQGVELVIWLMNLKDMDV